MNIDLLPFGASAIESPAATERPRGEVHTLTLRLARPAPHSVEAAMSGSVSIDPLPTEPESLLRAAVLPARGPILTITF